MLVLSRKTDETILINDNIKITIVRVHRGHVRIGIEAPREISVRRGELPPLTENTVGEPLAPTTGAQIEATRPLEPANRLSNVWSSNVAASQPLETAPQPKRPAVRPNATLRAMVAAIRQQGHTAG